MATVAEILAAAERADKAGDAPAARVLRDRAAQMQGPSPEAIQAAAEKAKAAGDTAAYNALVARLPKPTAPQADGPVTNARADDPAADKAARFAKFKAANPTIADRYTVDNFPKPGDVVMGVGGGGKSGGARYTVQAEPDTDTFGDTAAAMVEGPLNAASAFAGGLTGGPSPSREYLANDPTTGNLPNFALTGLGYLGDAGGAALSALGAGISGTIGLGTELVPGQDAAAEEKLGGDLLGMSMFAVPELAGASSIPARAAASAPKVAPVAKAAPKLADDVPVTAPSNVVPATPEEIGALANKAASGGMGAVKAQEALAAQARINPEAKAAADRLGIDLPADVFSDNEILQATVGLTRSEVGKEAESLWRRAIKDARDKADEIMASLDGSPDIASVSEAVKGALSATQANLKAAAKTLYEKVDAVVPKGAQAEVSNIVRALNDVIGDLGGPEGMTAAEKSLYALVTSPNQPVTYGRLIREKNLIGKAIARGDSPYSSMDSATLNRLYGAIAEDQLATVTNIGGDVLRSQLREANQLTAKQKGLEKRIVTAFGSDLDGSIGAKLKSAIKQGSQGDIAGLQRILKVIPEDLRQNAVASAIAGATRSARATEPGFGLAEFGKVFGGIITNKPVYNLIGKTLGPEAMAVLKDLHTVAQRISKADSNVLRTGKANQALVNAATAEGIIGRALHSTAGQRITQAAAIGGASAMTGPLGAMLAGPLSAALVSARPDTLAKLAKLFASDEFQSLLLAPRPEAVNAVSRSKAFTDWAKSARVRDPDAVLKALEGAGLPAGQAAASEAANANRRPEYEALWGRY